MFGWLQVRSHSLPITVDLDHCFSLQVHQNALGIFVVFSRPATKFRPIHEKRHTSLVYVKIVSNDLPSLLFFHIYDFPALLISFHINFVIQIYL